MEARSLEAGSSFATARGHSSNSLTGQPIILSRSFLLRMFADELAATAAPSLFLNRAPRRSTSGEPSFASRRRTPFTARPSRGTRGSHRVKAGPPSGGNSCGSKDDSNASVCCGMPAPVSASPGQFLARQTTTATSVATATIT